MFLRPIMGKQALSYLSDVHLLSLAPRTLLLTLRGTPGEHLPLLPVVPEQSTKYLLTVSRWMFPSLLEGGNQCHRLVGLCLPKGGDHASEMRQSKGVVRHLKCCSVWIRKCRRGVLKTEIAEHTRSTS